MPTATALGFREAFRAIPKEQREANQSFAIRVWRGLSWLAPVRTPIGSCGATTTCCWMGGVSRWC